MAAHPHVQRQAPGAGAFAFDFGGLYRKTLTPVVLGAGVNVQHIGPEVKFANEDETSPLGRNLKVGGAVTVPMPVGASGYEVGATIAVDHNRSLVESKYHTWHYGGEIYAGYKKWVKAAVRAGYYDDPLNDTQDATYGGGIRVAGFSVDFASIPRPPVAFSLEEERLHRWTFGFHSDLLLALGAR